MICGMLVATISLLVIITLIWMRYRRTAEEPKFVTREINGRQVRIETTDDLMADVIAAALRTGRPHTANRDSKTGITEIRPCYEAGVPRVP